MRFPLFSEKRETLDNAAVFGFYFVAASSISSTWPQFTR